MGIASKINPLAAAFVGALVLAGCSSDKTEKGLAKEIAGSLTSVITAKRAGRPPVVNMTAAQLSQIDVGLIQINPLKFGGSNFLTRATQRSDSRGSTVEVWQSTDNAQIILNSGVLVGTRGVGSDIIASNATQTVNAVTNRRNGQGTRTYQVSDGDSTSTDVALNCTWNTSGSENIVVVNQSFNTIHMIESCTDNSGNDASIENHYWVQSNGMIRKSRQWAGPAVDYFEIIRLKN